MLGSAFQFAYWKIWL